MDEKKKRTQIAFDVQPEFRQEIKVLAARRNISLNLWLMRAINDYIKKERKYDEKTKRSL